MPLSPVNAAPPHAARVLFGRTGDLTRLPCLRHSLPHHPQAAEALFGRVYELIQEAMEHMSEEEKAKDIKPMKPTVCVGVCVPAHGAGGPLCVCARVRVRVHDFLQFGCNFQDRCAAACCCCS